jgi:hypothetical protein
MWRFERLASIGKEADNARRLSARRKAAAKLSFVIGGVSAQGARA